jgi:hypothetical protein
LSNCLASQPRKKESCLMVLSEPIIINIGEKDRLGKNNYPK